MANFWVANGSSCITAPTLGDLVSLNGRVEVTSTVYIDFNSVSTGYLYSQATATNANRELGPHFVTSSFDTWAGGLSTRFGLTSTIFPTITFGEIKTITDYNAATFDALLDGVSLLGGPQPINVGASRSDTCLFRIGARASTNPGNDPLANGFVINSGAKFSDTHVAVYDSLGALVEERLYVMPSSGTTVIDTISGQNGTLRDGTGDGSDWEVFDSISPPDAGIGVFSLLPEDLTQRTISFSNVYSGITPTTINYVVYQNDIAITSPTPVDSFGGGSYSIDITLPSGEAYSVEVTANDGVDDYVATSDYFAVAIGVVFTGSSSAERWSTRGTGTLDTGASLLFRPQGGSITRYTNADGAISGDAMVSIVNAIYAATGSPVAIFMHADSGTQINISWDVDGALHGLVISELSGAGATAVIDACGLNDAYAQYSVSVAEIRDAYISYRNNLGAVIISGNSQRNGRLDRTQFFIDLFESYNTTYNELSSYVRPFYRIDLEITVDDIHLTDSDSLLSAQRAAQALLYYTGSVSYGKGPSISSATYAGTAVNINLDNAGTSYTQITPQTGIAGFKFTDDSGDVPTTAVDVVDSSRIAATLSRSVVGTLNMGFAAYDDNAAGTGVRPYSNYPAVDSAIGMPIDPLFQDITVPEGDTVSLSCKLSISLSIGL